MIIGGGMAYTFLKVQAKILMPRRGVFPAQSTNIQGMDLNLDFSLARFLFEKGAGHPRNQTNDTHTMDGQKRSPCKYQETNTSIRSICQQTWVPCEKGGRVSLSLKQPFGAIDQKQRQRSRRRLEVEHRQG